MRPIVIALGLLAGCGDGVTEVIVHFDADPSLAAAAARMRVVVRGEGEGDCDPYDETHALGDAPGEVTFPTTVPVQPCEGDASRRFTVEGILEDDGGARLGSVSERTGFVEGERTHLFLTFTATDADAGPSSDAAIADAAPSDAAAGCECPCADDECVDGRCVPAAPVEAVESAYDHTCAIDGSGRLSCWGANASGQLGLGDADPRDVPERVALDEVALDVSTGEAHSCAVLGDGTLRCWGESQYARLGHELAEDQLVPIASCDGSDWAAVALGGSHTCALGSAGLACWGNNRDGQLGIDATWSASDDCVLVDGDWSAFSAGHAHTCALRRTDDRLYCWGEHTAGRLAEGSPRLTEDQYAPHDATGGVQYADLSLGFRHACAIERTGALRCWGDNADGRVGLDGWDEPPFQVEIGEDTDWVAVAAGGRHTCGIRELDGGSLWCWGLAENGQLGVEGAAGGHEQLRVAGTGWVDVTAGREHTCAVRGDGTLWCWGRNAFGQLGLGDRGGRAPPARTCLPPP